MKTITYLTTNPHKMEEAEEFFTKQQGIKLKIMTAGFEVPEIQAKTCAEVVAFSVKYAADKLGEPVIKSDAGLYIDALGGLPGPYNAYFDKQIGVEKFLELFKNEKNRKARLEYCFGFCEPGKEPVVFASGGTGTIATEARGKSGRWHQFFYIPDGEEHTLNELRDIDYNKELAAWGDAKEQLAKWLKEKYEV